MNNISIKGYKSFRNIELGLKRINLLIGANGAGKSNFLSLFEMLGCIYDKRLAQFTAMAGGVGRLLYRGRKETESIDVTVSEGQNYYTLSLMESDGRLIVAHERLGYCTQSGWCNSIDIANYSDEANIKTYNGLKRGDYIKDYLSQIRKFHFHDTGRKSPFTQECHVVNDSYRMYEHGENLSAILLRIQKEKPMVYRRIVSVIQSIAPFFSDFYFQPTEAGMLRLQWQDKYSGVIYGPNDLSDGTIRFIALTVLFMQPWTPKVIVIDEPELGLHPKAIDKLAGLIKLASKNGAQVICATQSADLISNFEPDEVLTVNQYEDGTRIERLDERSLASWLEDYTLGELWKQNILKGGQPL